MTGILYFSSTGNSLQIAKAIAKREKADIFYIPTYTGNGSEFNKLVIVCPIYSYGLPLHVYNLIPKLSKEIPLHIVLNYGGITGGADYFTYTYCVENRLNITSVHTIKMIENFTLTFSVPKVYSNATTKSAPKRIAKVVESVYRNEHIIPKKKNIKSETHLKNMSNWHHIADDFSTTVNCVKCGKCVDICPSKNISIINGKVVFADKCVACLGCYHRCPKKAIIYKNKLKKYRYINPSIKEQELCKDVLFKK